MLGNLYNNNGSRTTEKYTI